MTTANFEQIQAQAYELYQAQRYAEAYELLLQYAHRFPERRWSIDNWKMCFAARAGKTDEALRVFRQAVDQGLWWAASILREDPDLASLQEDGEFNRLVEICDQRHQAALKEGPKDLRVFIPNKSSHLPYPLLIVFHGYSGCAGETAPYWQSAVEEGWLVAVAQSSQPVGSGGFAWTDDQLARVEIEALYRDLIEQYPLDTERVVLGGFSQGGGLAIRLAVRQDLPVRGFVAVAPYLPDIEPLLAAPDLEPGDRPRGYLVLGGQDPDHASFERIQSLLQEKSIPYQFEEHSEIGHTYPLDFASALPRALAFILHTQETG